MTITIYLSIIAMDGAGSALSQSGRYYAFRSGIGGSGAEAFSPFLPPHGFHSYGP